MAVSENPLTKAPQRINFGGACVPQTPRACRSPYFERVWHHLTSGTLLEAIRRHTLDLNLQLLH